MARATPVKLTTIEFGKKTDALKFFQEMLQRYQPRQCVSPSDSIHLAALLKHHAENASSTNRLKRGATTRAGQVLQRGCTIGALRGRRRRESAHAKCWPQGMDGGRSRSCCSRNGAPSRKPRFRYRRLDGDCRTSAQRAGRTARPQNHEAPPEASTRSAQLRVCLMLKCVATNARRPAFLNRARRPAPGRGVAVRHKECARIMNRR